MRKLTLLGMMSAALMASIANAGVISVTGTFQNTISPSLSSGAFWDNRSLDGNYGQPATGCNAGYYAVGLLPPGTSKAPNCQNMWPGTKANQGGFAGGTYLGSGPSGTNPADFLFSAGQYKITLYAGMIAKSFSQIGYFTFDANGNRVLNPLFANSNGLTDPSNIGQSAMINATGNFGFYITTSNGFAGATTFYSDMAFNGFNQESNHAVLMREANPSGFAKYFLGFEDSPTKRPLLAKPNSYDADYNDYMLHFEQVPEPGTYGMLGMALAGVVAMVRRRKA